MPGYMTHDFLVTCCFPCMSCISCVAAAASVATSMLQWMELGSQGVRLHSVGIVILLMLGFGRVTLANEDDFSTSSPLHVSDIQMLQYLVKTNNSSISQGRPPATGLYAFLSVQLSKPVHMQIRRAVLGFSTDQCEDTVLHRAALSLWDTSLGSRSVTLPVLVPLDGEHQVLGRSYNLCLRARYASGEEEVFTGWRMQMKQFTFPLVSPGNVVRYDQAVEETHQEENSFALEIGSLENEEDSNDAGMDVSWMEGWLTNIWSKQILFVELHFNISGDN